MNEVTIKFTNKTDKDFDAILFKGCTRWGNPEGISVEVFYPELGSEFSGNIEKWKFESTNKEQYKELIFFHSIDSTGRKYTSRFSLGHKRLLENDFNVTEILVEKKYTLQPNSHITFNLKANTELLITLNPNE